jgi:hypothetical protein
MVGANEANRPLIGPALNRPIREGDWVHLGVAPQRDGLTACIRRSVVAVDHPSRVTEEQKFWFELVEEGYRVGEDAYRKPRRNACRHVFKSRHSSITSQGAPMKSRLVLARRSTCLAKAVHGRLQFRLHRMPGIFWRHNA